MAGGCGEMPTKEDKTKSGNGCPESNSTKADKDPFGRKIDDCIIDAKKEPECHDSQKKFFENSNNGKEEGKEDKDKQREEKNNDENDELFNGSALCKRAERKIEDVICEAVKDREVIRICDDKESYGCKGLTPEPNTCAQQDCPPMPTLMAVKPCLPRLERSKADSCKRKSEVSCKPAASPCMSANDKKNPCVRIKVPPVPEFFCIDARNKRMNECIKKYMNDPNQLALQCAQFAKKGIHTGVQRKLATESRFFSVIPPKHRQLVRRYLPAAGLYLLATAVVAVWVTEWGPVVNRIPFYRPKEEVPKQETNKKESDE